MNEFIMKKIDRAPFKNCLYVFRIFFYFNYLSINLWEISGLVVSIIFFIDTFRSLILHFKITTLIFRDARIRKKRKKRTKNKNRKKFNRIVTRENGWVTRGFNKKHYLGEEFLNVMLRWPMKEATCVSHQF